MAAIFQFDPDFSPPLSQAVDSVVLRKLYIVSSIDCYLKAITFACLSELLVRLPNDRRNARVGIGSNRDDFAWYGFNLANRPKRTIYLVQNTLVHRWGGVLARRCKDKGPGHCFLPFGTFRDGLERGGQGFRALTKEY